MSHDRLTLVGQTRFTIGPTLPADLIGTVEVSLTPGGLQEDSAAVPGRDGAERTFLGYTDAEASVTVRIWDEGQLPRLRRLADLFRPRRGSPPTPVQVVHPSFSLWRIGYVYIVRLQEAPYSAKDGYSLNLTLREWQPKEKRKTEKTAKVQGQGQSKDDDYSFLERGDVPRPSDKPPRP